MSKRAGTTDKCPDCEVAKLSKIGIRDRVLAALIKQSKLLFVITASLDQAVSDLNVIESSLGLAAERSIPSIKDSIVLRRAADCMIMYMQEASCIAVLACEFCSKLVAAFGVPTIVATPGCAEREPGVFSYREMCARLVLLRDVREEESKCTHDTAAVRRNKALMEEPD